MRLSYNGWFVFSQPVRLLVDLSGIWIIIKNKIDNGVKRFVPLTSRFNTTKWKRPLSSEIRSQIRHKKTLWRNYVRDKNSTTWLQYTKQRNKVKRIVVTLKKNRI